jgi:1-acyl-sn-glycerol-3-phosphate acyltransferase
MAKIWEPYRGYTRCRRYTDWITRSCFRSIRIEGMERIPHAGAVLLAPNHCATLMDPMLQLLLRPKRDPIAFGARSDIFAKPRTARILHWLRIVPLARERNGLAEVAKNFEVFDEIVDCLDHDVPFCMYAEGTHRAERGMLPLKKGLFRVAKMASDQLGKPVYIYPIGTCYEDFFRGQTRVRMRVGEPMEIAEEFAKRADKPEAEIYRELCEELRERVIALIGEPIERRHDRRGLRLLLSVLSLPLFAVCAVGALPIWLPYLLIMRGMKDKAWSLTVRFALHFVLPLFIPFDIGFQRLLNDYRELVADMR